MFFHRALLPAALIVAAPIASAAVSCGDILFSSDGLTSNLNCTSGYVAVEIRGDDVVLDLNGYTLGGNILEGILVTGNRVTVRGPGTIKGFQNGLQSYDTSELTVRNVEFRDMVQGMVATGTTDALIENNLFLHLPGIGISIKGYDSGGTVLPSTGNRIFKNEFAEAGTGINVCGYNATHLDVVQNQFSEIVDFAVQLETGANHNSIHDNWFYDVDGTGIRLSNANMNVVTSNYLKSGRIGISIHDNNGSTNPTCAQPPSVSVVTGNLAEGNTVLNHETAVSLGLGITTSPVVIANRIANNKLYYNQYGIWFREDAWMNQAPGNAYTGTVTPVVDAGTGNVY